MDFKAVCDTREQKPLKLKTKSGSPIPTVRATLYTGDYSIVGLEHHVAIERKSLDDLMGCIGTGRDRFEKEITRLLAYPVRCIVVESSWEEIEKGAYRSRVPATAAIGTLMGWMAQGIPICMTGTHARSGVFVGRMLWITAKRRHLELKSLGGV